MSNIIGSPFADFVKKQIEVRQKALGQTTNISADDLKYYTTKTPWLRLASSVQLNGEEGDGSVLDKLIKAGVPKELIQGDNLAKNFILQGGALSIDDNGNAKLNKGLNYNNNIFNGAYGWGGLDERGYVPMPGLEGASTNYYNNGALSESTIKIKCYSKAQFQLLDALYLRPGYSLLLEFGWSTFLNNSGEIATYEGFKSAPLSFLLNPGSFDGGQNQFQMMNLIQDERVKYDGNYEAVYGKITNFKWSFGSDGSYSCEVKLIGMGSVIESLKLNVTDPKKNNESESGSELTQFNQTFEQFVKNFIGKKVGQIVLNGGGFNKIVGNAARAQLYMKLDQKVKMNASSKQILDYIRPKYEARKSEVEAVKQENVNNNPLLANRDDTKLNKIFYDIYQHMDATYLNSFLDVFTKTGGVFAICNEIQNGAFILDDTFVGEKSVRKGGGDKVGKSVYLKFATLLKIIEENCNLFSKKDGGTGMLKFDFDYMNLENDQNFMLIIPPNLSTNPQKCLVPYNKLSIKGVTSYSNDIPTDTPLNKVLRANSNFLVSDNAYVGRLGNVLINMKFAAGALADAQRDDDGSISVLSYIKTLLDGVNESMGSINNFFVSFDEDDGTIKIYDETPKPGLVENIPSKFTRINIFGVKKDQGSFVTNINLDASIPKNFATMIAIGAQAGGNNLMGNSTSFSNYNKGLIDRIIPEKIDYQQSKDNDDKTNPEKQAKTIKQEKLYYTKDPNKISPIGAMYLKQGQGDGASSNSYNFSEEISNDLTENYTTYLKLIQGELTNKDQVPAPFFLPFNLNLDLEGISGIKLFEKFKITDDILPPSYEKDSVDIIVKALNHQVDVQKWSTVIDTLSVPSFGPLPIEDSKDENVATQSEKQQKLEEAAQDPVETDPDSDLITRLRLTRLVDNGYQTLGLLEVFDENGNTLYALPTVELPWKDNRNSESCIPTGKYTVASRTSPKYGDCFMLANNEVEDRQRILAQGGPITGYNTTNRTYVLIHEAPAAQGNTKPWLLGCMAPGFKFNTKQKDKFGNPRGTGPQYGGKTSLSHLESIEANKKLLGTLWNTGKNPMFKLVIRALGGVNRPANTDFNSFGVDSEIRKIENITGEKYTYA